MPNLIDFAILALFALSVLIGLYRGSVATGLNLIAGIGLSLLLARLCYPLVSDWIAAHDKWMEWLVYLSEGSSHIPTAMMEYARADVVTLTESQITQVITASGFSAPFDSYLLHNITNQVYAGSYTTLFDYFDQTVADVSLNTISFVLCFGFTFIVSSLLITLMNKTLSFPVLRVMDGLAGGVLGLARGFVLMMVLATMVPLVLNMLQIDLITEMVDGSRFLSAFYPNNWFFGWISSVL